MKNTILTIVVAIMAIINVNAIELPTISAANEKAFILDLNDWKNQDVKVTILNAIGEYVYTEDIIANAKRMKRYNLENLPKGVYTVNLENAQKELAFEISIGYHGISIEEDKELTFKPTIKVSQEKIDINVFALYNDVVVSLTDNAGEEVYTDKQRDHRNYGKRLNIAQLPKGDYTLSVKVGDNTYIRSIKK